MGQMLFKPWRLSLYSKQGNFRGIKMRFFSATLMSLALFEVTACSGGGGGGSSSTPTPPASSNTAPVISVAISNASVEEGRGFSIDLTGSTDADGDTLTFSVTQTNGQSAGNPPSDQTFATVDGLFAFGAPEVVADQTIEFEVSASDGQATVTDTVSISVVNVNLVPQRALFGSTIETLMDVTAPQKSNLIVSSFLVFAEITGVGSGQAGLEFFKYPVDLDTEAFENIVVTPIENSTRDQEVKLAFSAIFAPSFIGRDAIITMPADNRVALVSASGDPEMAEFSNIEGLCNVKGVVAGRVADLLFGTESDGLRLRFNDDRSFISPGAPGSAGMFSSFTDLTTSGNACNFVVDEASSIVSLLDLENGEIHNWDIIDSGNAFDLAVIELDSISVDLPANLEVADFQALRDTSGHVIFKIAMTDGVHQGDHRLIFYNNDFSGGTVFEKTEFQWTKGIPRNLTTIPTNDGSSPLSSDTFLTLETVPFGVVVETTGDLFMGDSGPSFGSFAYAPIPLGTSHTSISFSNFAFDLLNFSVAFTRTQFDEIIYLEAPF